MACKKTYYVSKAGRDLAAKGTSQSRRAQAAKTLANHKSKHH